MKKKLSNEEMLSAMRDHPAIQIPYAEYDENAPLQCPICDWKGTPKESGMVENGEFCLYVECPDCEKMLLVAEFPLAHE